ncbi:hypothetical protein CONPUDRAFT_154833 [Coniophora puteana RWD-64-598 SS2]|uniref:Uncharacterized protein n=1 Tax=Coniophora puteana (strain RWD-64-598) TaxID=741705 RepID=A0A5M3MP29_CONPW|nr:uncharacterized protein CONPUDRAFT_154833 [Coniophora puteana RWD-64-598 SS2]EIW80843.1 hypothetical protein CONPUDRAFT_154833 [Coniophora puteana RWD-64-598 SS2]
MPSVDIGEGYALLHKRSKCEWIPVGVPKAVLDNWLGCDCGSIWMWGCDNIWISRNVKIAEEGRTYIGKVQYFAQLDVQDEVTGELRWEGVAVVELYSEPDPDLLTLSSHFIKQITDIVGMVPHRPTLLSGVEEDHFFMAEKPGLDVATFLGHEDEDEQDEDGMDFPPNAV